MRHVEVLLLQPQVVMVVVITSTGGVTKRASRSTEPVDPGLVAWAAEYLNERRRRRRGSARALLRAARSTSRASATRARVPRRDPPRVQSSPRASAALYVGGAAGLLDELRAEEIGAYRSLMEVLEKRAALLDVLAQPFDPRRPFARVGDELDQPGLRDARARRRDLRAARTGRSARSACSARCGWTTRRRSAPCAPPPTSSRASSRTPTRSSAGVPTVPRLRYGAWQPPNATTTSCSASPRTRRRRDQEGVPQARARAAPRRLRRARRRDALPRGGRGVRGAVEAGDARALRPLRARGAALGRLPPGDFDFGNLGDLFSAFFGDDLFARSRGGRGARRRRRRGDRDRARRGRARRRAVEVDVRGRRRPARTCERRRRRAGHRARHVPACGGTGRLQQVSRSVFGEFVRTQALPAVRRHRPRWSSTPCRDVRRAPAASLEAKQVSTSRFPPASTTASGSGSRATATRARTAAGRRRLRPRARPAATSASCATATTSSRRST